MTEDIKSIESKQQLVMFSLQDLHLRAQALAMALAEDELQRLGPNKSVDLKVMRKRQKGEKKVKKEIEEKLQQLNPIVTQLKLSIEKIVDAEEEKMQSRISSVSEEDSATQEETDTSEEEEKQQSRISSVSEEDPSKQDETAIAEEEEKEQSRSSSALVADSAKQEKDQSRRSSVSGKESAKRKEKARAKEEKEQSRKGSFSTQEAAKQDRKAIPEEKKKERSRRNSISEEDLTKEDATDVAEEEENEQSSGRAVSEEGSYSEEEEEETPLTQVLGLLSLQQLIKAKLQLIYDVMAYVDILQEISLRGTSKCRHKKK